MEGSSEGDCTIIRVVPGRIPNTECPMCLEKLHNMHERGGSGYAVTGCGHAYHVSCLVIYVMRSHGDDPSCPICRQSLIHRDT